MYFLFAAINSRFRGPFPCDFCTNPERRSEKKQQINQQKWQLLSFLPKAAAVREHETGQKATPFAENKKAKPDAQAAARLAPAPNITEASA